MQGEVEHLVFEGSNGISQSVKAQGMAESEGKWLGQSSNVPCFGSQITHAQSFSVEYHAAGGLGDQFRFLSIVKDQWGLQTTVFGGVIGL